jgi:hypothetical protein
VGVKLGTVPNPGPKSDVPIRQDGITSLSRSATRTGALNPLTASGWSSGAGGIDRAVGVDTRPGVDVPGGAAVAVGVRPAVSGEGVIEDSPPPLEHPTAIQIATADRTVAQRLAFAGCILPIKLSKYGGFRPDLT